MYVYGESPPTYADTEEVIHQYYEAGVDVGTVAAQLGQSPEVALKYYRQVTKTHKTKAVAIAGIGVREPSNVIPLREKKSGWQTRTTRPAHIVRRPEERHPWKFLWKE